jgi:predicted ABC-type transport system involved in lysophospholipase L1 biosynthesis ATPase subunit
VNNEPRSSDVSDPLLTARGLRKTYLSGDRRIEVLNAIDFEVSAGESVSIRGESGSGKSTLLNLFAGIDRPDSGTLTWRGFTKVDNAARARFLGIIFQSFYLMPELNALENVIMARRIVGPVGAAERTRAVDLLHRVGLTERARHLPSQLSGGERQRVAVARALMNAPPLVLADEPTGNLDERTGDTVVDLLLSLCAETKTALVLVTHNGAHAAKTSRHLFLQEGRLAAERTG